MKKEFLALALSCLSNCLTAQTSLPGIIPSPNASDLGHYGNIPVSLFTGKPEIKIPLFQLEARGVSLPVSLNHDATGVLLNSLPGWTGHNWTLQAGGCITRVICGYNDDRFLLDEERNLFPNFRNHFQSYASLQRALNHPENDYEWLKDSLITGNYDYAPDIYYFNFMGHSGRFFLGDDGQWKVDSEENIEVIFDYNNNANYIYPFISTFPSGGNQPKTIKGFVLRDEEGNRYYFGGETDYIEYTINFFETSAVGKSASWAANSWYLRRIEDRHGKELFTLSYTRGNFIAHVFYVAQSIDNYALSQFSFFPFTLSASGGGFYNNYDFPYCVQLIAPIYLESIQSVIGEKLFFSTYDLGPSHSTYSSLYNTYGSGLYQKLKERVYPQTQFQLPFYYLQTDDAAITPYQYNWSSRAKLTDPFATTSLKFLNMIQRINTSTNKLLANVELHYDYITRPHLVEVEFRDARMGQKYKYTLSYNQYALPTDYLTRQIDHWGYYRGMEAELGPTNFANYYDSRNPVPAYTQYGLLNSITYPTGGVTKFYYQQNDYSSYQSEDRSYMVGVAEDAYAGGVRISRIEDYEDAECTTMLQCRTYDYTDPLTGRSSGQLFARAKYYWQNWRGKTIDGSATSYFSQFCTSAVLPLANSFGPHIGYSCVTENRGNGSKAVYRFSNISDAHDIYMFPHFSYAGPTPYDVYSERDYKRGKLMSVSLYDGDHLKKRTEYTYRADNVENKYVLSTNIGVGNYSTSVSTMFYTGGIYKLFYPKYDVVSERTTNYYPSGNIVDQLNIQRSDLQLQISDGAYSHLVDVRTVSSETHTRGDKHEETLYSYPFYSQSNIERQLTYQQFYLKPKGTEHKENGITTYKQRTDFKSYSGLIVPAYEIETKNGQGSEIARTYIDYDTTTGRVLSYRDLGKAITTLEWEANGCLLKRMKEGNGHTVTINHNEYMSPSSIMQINGSTNTYGYDYMGRLTEIHGTKGLEKQFDYNYTNK